MALCKDIILYHYTYSPFARRIVWYLNLRKIPYSQCLQPPIMPRPDIAALGVEYRRIPIMAIGRDIYHDTRLILRKLEQLFPGSDAHPAISASDPEQRGIEKLLELWIIDGGVFARGSQLLPTSLPLMKDVKFTKDREEYTGVPWSKDAVEAKRPEALVEMKNAFALLEDTLLADGREWVLKTQSPSLADIEAVWPFHWMQGIRGALQADCISAQQFPKSFAWIDRFQKFVSAAAKARGKPKTINGDEAVAQIKSSEFAEADPKVDTGDPSGLSSGQAVEVWPIDTGFKSKDKGSLAGLTSNEIVIETKTKEGNTVVRIHTPRHGFRIRVAEKSSKL